MPGSEPRLANGVGLGGHDASAMAIVHLCRGAVYPFEAKGLKLPGRTRGSMLK